MTRSAYAIFILFLSLAVFVQRSYSCEFCTIVNLGKQEKSQEDKRYGIETKVIYEEQDWEEIPARDAHELHHDGRHFHDKQDEQIVHVMIRARAGDRLSVEADIPYVTRHFIEIDSHAHLGENQTSTGLGDILLTGNYRLFKDQARSLGIIAGLKFPSGETGERNSFGGLIEPELQPGSGSLDYIAGFSGSFHPRDMDLSASAIYIYRNEGEQDFRFGDLLSVSLYSGTRFKFKDKWTLKTGVMLNHQLEKKQNGVDGDIKDSGGYTMLMGPQLGLIYDPVQIEFAYLAPVIQNLGGVHQELDTGLWTASLGVKF